MLEVSNKAILAAAADVATATVKSAQARAKLAAPPPVDSEEHPASAAGESSSGVGTHSPGGAG